MIIKKYFEYDINHVLKFIMFLVTIQIVFNISISMIPIPLFNYYSQFRILLMISIAIILISLSKNERIINDSIGKLFFLFVVGYLISLTFGISDYGLKYLNKYGGALKPERVFVGFLFYFSFLYTIKDLRTADNLLWWIIVTSIFVILSIKLGITSGLSGIITNQTFSDQYDITKEYINKTEYYVRETFLTLDTNNYAGIISTIFLFCLYYWDKTRRDYFRRGLLILAMFLITWSLLSTLSRVGMIKFGFIIIVFSFLYYGVKKSRTVTYLFIGLIIALFIIQTNNFISDLFLNRFQQIIQNLPFLFSSLNYINPSDNFTFRIIMAKYSIDHMPSFFIGSGGPTIVLQQFRSGNHIDWVNWLSQYGLVTFIPLIIWQISIFVKIYRIKNLMVSKSILTRQNLLTLSLLATLLLSTWLEMFNTPLFYIFWVWTAIVHSGILALQKSIPNYET